jgi:hypothetical protein
MTPLHQQQQQNMAKDVCRVESTHWSLRFGPIVLSFWFVIFLNLQSFGEGLDFCFDGSKEGGFLSTEKCTYATQNSE